MSTADASAAFDIRELLTPAAFPHAVTEPKLIETHISWIVLTGHYAYKVKKPVHFDFIDASTLERRHQLCREELRLNQRFARDLYVDVCAIARENGQLKVGVDGPAVEYAVRMHQFEPSQELSSRLAEGTVTPHDMTSLANALADFHRGAAVAAASSPYGTLEAVTAQIHDNQSVLSQYVRGTQRESVVARLSEWLNSVLYELKPVIHQRKRMGAVRECHGDLHARNIVRWRQQWMPFDCIEFNPDLRWIDVMSDVAFLFMDLAAHDRQDLAYAFLSRYLEDSGDYVGLRLLRLYAVYRALVRAKIDAIGAASVPQESAQALLTREMERLRIASELTQPAKAVLMITHGVTAVGKSWLSERLINSIHAVRVRSDLERKRLAGLAPLERSDSGVGEKLYAGETTDRTYARLRECAASGLAAGLNMIVDAAFLRASQRASFRELALEHRCRFVIMSCHASRATLHARLDTRKRIGLDPSEATVAVLEHQLATQEPLTPEEQEHVILIDTNWLTSADAGIESVRTRVADTA
jgi:aminoglycoside phosphotransferase family enzyme/predicted kinase